MNQQDHLFENSKQLSQKLAVALTRFFLDGPLDPSLEERYRQFLRRRPFTALQWILHQGTPALLERYLAAGWISRQDLERGLAQDDLSLQMRALLLQALDDGQPPQASPPEFDALSLLELTQLKLFERLPGCGWRFPRFSFSPTEKGSGTDGAVIYYSQPQIVPCSVREGWKRSICIWSSTVSGCILPGRLKKTDRTFPTACGISPAISVLFICRNSFSPLPPMILPTKRIRAGRFCARFQTAWIFPPPLPWQNFSPAVKAFRLQNGPPFLPSMTTAGGAVPPIPAMCSPGRGFAGKWAPSLLPRQRFGLNPGSRLERLELRREAKLISAVTCAVSP